MAVFVALSAAGAMIKIPSPTGTVALDSCPGYFSGLTFGGLEGAIVAAMGHLFTAATGGFTLGVFLHVIIAVEMGLFAAAFWWANKKLGLVAAVIVATGLNGVLCAFTVLPVGGLGFALSMIPPLLIGSAVNIIVAAAAYKGVSSRMI